MDLIRKCLSKAWHNHPQTTRLYFQKYQLKVFHSVAFYFFVFIGNASHLGPQNGTIDNEFSLSLTLAGSGFPTFMRERVIRGYDQSNYFLAFPFFGSSWHWTLITANVQIWVQVVFCVRPASFIVSPAMPAVRFVKHLAFISPSVIVEQSREISNIEKHRLSIGKCTNAGNSHELSNHIKLHM